ncbi:TPA: ribonuclease P protein component [Streptococcus suis]
MKKQYRVKSEKDFQTAFQGGQSVANRQLVLYAYPKPEQVHFRVGFSVGKKMGNAVQRNLIKRRLRQAVHELSTALDPQFDYLVIARFDICNKNYAQIKKSLIHVMNLASVIDKNHIEGLSSKQ